VRPPQVGEIADIEPLHVAAYIEALGNDFEKPKVKQHLATIRMLFDWLVTGQIVATNRRERSWNIGGHFPPGADGGAWAGKSVYPSRPVGECRMCHPS
jgi:hypothetical protein